MKVINISDELYEQLKNCVVDPFDDTPESVIRRLIEIAQKARSKWSPLDAHVKDAERREQPGHWSQQTDQML